ncbi:Crotonase superfamily [Trichophyton rubrum]|nr:Crotonase superfamily [Trichophyton rubrum]
MSFSSSPPESPFYTLSYPEQGVLLATINRPRHMNSIPFQGHWDFEKLWTWFENEGSMQVAIITGAGDKAFCAGQDLIEIEQNAINPPPEPYLTGHPRSGFAGISQRRGKKPIIAAVNGFADMVVASPKARFSLPEAKRGVYAAAGGLARLMRIVGLQIASEIAMTGRVVSPEEGKAWQFVNRISKTHESLIEETLELAREISQLSPDALIITKAGLREAWETGNVEVAVANIRAQYDRKLYGGENLAEGLAAFRERRKPNWVKSQL